LPASPRRKRQSKCLRLASSVFNGNIRFDVLGWLGNVQRRHEHGVLHRLVTHGSRPLQQGGAPENYRVYIVMENRLASSCVSEVVEKLLWKTISVAVKDDR